VIGGTRIHYDLGHIQAPRLLWLRPHLEFRVGAAPT
jgi:hypothetical protein